MVSTHLNNISHFFDNRSQLLVSVLGQEKKAQMRCDKATAKSLCPHIHLSFTCEWTEKAMRRSKTTDSDRPAHWLHWLHCHILHRCSPGYSLLGNPVTYNNRQSLSCLSLLCLPLPGSWCTNSMMPCIGGVRALGKKRCSMPPCQSSLPLVGGFNPFEKY